MMTSGVAGLKVEGRKSLRWPRWSALVTFDLRPSDLRLFLREERPQRRVDVALALDDDRLEFGVAELAEGAHQGAAAVIALVLADLAVAELVGAAQELLDEVQADLVVGVPVVAIGKVEGIDVPVGRRVVRV